MMRKISEIDQPAWEVFIRHRRIATFLLILMGLLTIIGYLIPYYGYFNDNFWLHILRAGTQAGFIGGLADWFAVTALFRHPMGIPIPHTAILPMQQKRIGKGLGNFVANHVFTQSDVKKMLHRVDIASILAKYFTNPATIDMITKALISAMPKMLDRMEDGRASAVITRLFTRLFSGESASLLVARALRAMVDNRHHQEVLSFLLALFKDSLKAKEETFRQLIQERVREQGGRVLGWMIGSSIATKVLTAINQELDRIDPDNSELREGFTRWIREEIDQIEADPSRGNRIAETLTGIITHDSIKGWRGDLWHRIRDLIEEDMQKDESWIAGLIKDGLINLSKQLENDQLFRQKISNNVDKVAIQSLPYIRNWLSDFITNVVSDWDPDSLITRIECRVGKDLQYVRINGTIVGFIVGATLFLFLHFCFGPIAG